MKNNVEEQCKIVGGVAMGGEEGKRKKSYFDKEDKESNCSDRYDDRASESIGEGNRDQFEEEVGRDCILIDITTAPQDHVEGNGAAADNEIGNNIGNKINVVAADHTKAQLRTPHPESAPILGELVCHAPCLLAGMIL